MLMMRIILINDDDDDDGETLNYRIFFWLFDLLLLLLLLLLEWSSIIMDKHPLSVSEWVKEIIIHNVWLFNEYDDRVVINQKLDDKKQQQHMKKNWPNIFHFHSFIVDHCFTVKNIQIIRYHKTIVDLVYSIDNSVYCHFHCFCCKNNKFLK